MKIIVKHKWLLHWCAFGSLVCAFVAIAIFFEEKSWLGNVLQLIGTMAGIYLTLIIFLHSKEGSDKQFHKQLEHLQILNLEHIDALHKNTTRQIEAIQVSTEKQIATLQELNAKQIETLQGVTERQIEALHQLTEKQIDALNTTTYSQISSFEIQITEVTNKLSDNSILLGEILGRELEKSLDAFDTLLKKEEANLRNLSGWKLLRTPEEREAQLENQKSRIKHFKAWFDYIQNKLNHLRNYLSSDQHKLES